MMKYMLLFTLDGKTGAKFTDDPHEVEKWRFDAECGLGCYCEVYRREPEDGYKLLYS